MTRRFFVEGSLSEMMDMRAAISKAEGLPKRAVVFGGPDNLPQEYTGGSAGWTAHLCPEPIEAKDGTAALEVPEEAEKHLGKSVVVGGRRVDLRAKESLVEEKDVPDKYLERLRETRLSDAR